MKRLFIAGVLCAALAGPLISSPARAITVFDPRNFSQNVLIAARTLDQINNQITSLQNEARMLSNQALNLTGLNFNAIGKLRNALMQTNQLFDQARGLTYDVSRADADFARLYPEQYAATVSNDSMARDAIMRWTQSQQALRTTATLQAQVVRNLNDDQGTLADIVAQSQSAVGALQATQATNQLLALQTKQLMQQQQLQVAQDRATALGQAEDAAEMARARAVRQQFFGTGASRYTPQTVRFYP